MTVAAGKLAMIRGAAVYTVVEGSQITGGDILQTDADGRAQVEFQSGTRFSLGAATQVLVSALPRGRGDTDLVALTGWVKLAPGKSGTGALRVHMPGAQFVSENAIAVLHLGGSRAEIFVESGTGKFTETDKLAVAGRTRTVNGGEFVARTLEQPTVTAERPPVPFVSGMPRHFRDNLPVFLEKFKERKVEPKRDHEVAYGEIEAWLKLWPSLRKTFVKRFQSRAQDAEFRKGLINHLREHPEWDPVLFPEKYLPKPDQSSPSS